MARSRTGHRPTLVDNATGVALYVQIASTFRARILRGEWAAGGRIPTILELCAEYGVARVTIRQALQLLAAEGLLTSRRGKGSFVAADVPGPASRDELKVAISDPLSLAPTHKIRVLQRERVATPPPALTGGAALFPGYVRIRKLHLHRDTPFCVMDVYVAAEVFARFPRGAEKRAKIARLVRDHGAVQLSEAVQRITIAHADYRASDLLGCELGAPVATIERRFVDAQGRLVTTGTYVYRGDLFVLESHQRHDILRQSSIDWVPQSQDEASRNGGAAPRSKASRKRKEESS